MNAQTRRDFLRRVGAGAVAAGVGSGLASDLGLSKVLAQDEPRLTFGAMEPLVSLLQETPIAKLQPMLVNKLREGTTLKELTAAAALANARTFGGEDYIGFHSMFAFKPAYQMAQDLPEERRALPVLKALYRNTERIHAFGGRAKEVLRPVEASGSGDGEAVRDDIRGKDLKSAEAKYAAFRRDPAALLNQAQAALRDSTEVHRVNMVYRAWGLLDLVGLEHAHTLLRQSLHYFAVAEKNQKMDHFNGPRTVLPKLIDQHKLFEKPLGTKTFDDARLEAVSVELFQAAPERAAEIAAALLAEGTSPDAIHEAIGLAANQLVLRDENKQAHGATVGVHACDAVNAWKHIGAASDAKNAAAAVVMAAWNFAFDRDNPARNKMKEWEAYPRADARERVKSSDPAELLRELDGAIRAKDQALATAVAQRYGSLGAPESPVLALYRGFVVSQNGSLHGEKFFGTVSEEFARGRTPFRWRQLVAMARFAASMYGEPTPGYEEATRLLGLPS
ncbi:MAG TPA: twin-arginine translocation signal domain-containing protein [Planctomycetota bacterium]